VSISKSDAEPVDLLARPPNSVPDTGRLKRAIVRGLALGLLIGAVTGLGQLALEHLRPVPPLPVLGSVPSFQLTDQGGHSFGSADLAGHPWVAGFIFTSCTDTCPLITARMASLARKHPSLRLVSFTVDPARDGPAKLLDYGRKAGADFARWSFLTGPVETIRTLVTHGFKLTMLGGDPKAGEGDVVHDERLVLVDGAGHIRGYYDGDADGVARLDRDAARLLKGS
jgi:protein SCO1